MNEQAMRFRVGVFVLAALILLGVLIVLFAGHPTFLHQQHEYPIVLSDATGISVGTPVRRAGVRIGEVKRFDLDDATGQVRVIIAVDPAHPPLTGDQAMVVRGLLGSDAHIDLLPGPGAAPAKKQLNEAPGQPRILLVADPPPGQEQPRKPLPPGTQIPAASSTNAGQLAAQAGTLIPQSRRTLAEMEKTLRDYDRITIPLSMAIQEYTRLAAATRALVPEIQKTNEEIRTLARALNTTVPRLNQTTDQFQATARNWGRLGERLDALVATNQGKLTQAVDNLNTSLTRISNTFSEENQKNLATTLRNARTGSERLDSITKNTDALIRESRTTIQRVNGEIIRTDAVLGNLQKATQPLAERSDRITQNLDQGSVRFNASMASLQTMLQGFGKPNGTLGLLLNDPTLYNSLNAAACMLDRTLPQMDRLIRDLDVFADKIARHPETLGLGGVLHPSSGLKQSPFDDPSFGPHR